MRNGSDDWLDRLARRARAGTALRTREPETPDPSQERFSRGTAVKLAVASVASLSLGLWKAPPVYALDRGKCLSECLDRYEANLERRLRGCAEGTNALAGLSDWHDVLKLSVLPPAQLIVMAGGFCAMTEYAHSLINRERCVARCEETCPRTTQSRSVQGRARSTCEVSHPPEQGPPPIPTPAAPVDDCVLCENGGGFCCPGGPTGFCGCAPRCPGPGDCSDIGFVAGHAPCGPCLL